MTEKFQREPRESIQTGDQLVQRLRTNPPDMFKDAQGDINDYRGGLRTGRIFTILTFNALKARAESLFNGKSSFEEERDETVITHFEARYLQETSVDQNGCVMLRRYIPIIDFSRMQAAINERQRTLLPKETIGLYGFYPENIQRTFGIEVTRYRRDDTDKRVDVYKVLLSPDYFGHQNDRLSYGVFTNAGKIEDMPYTVAVGDSGLSPNLQLSIAESFGIPIAK